MNADSRSRSLRIALFVFGLVFVFGFYPLTVFWPAGWVWHQGRSEYIEMMIGLYATLGIFLLVAARRPEQHRSLIAFAIWSSIVHAGVMAVQAIANPMHGGHLLGDVPALLVVALVLGYLCPQAFRLQFGAAGS